MQEQHHHHHHQQQLGNQPGWPEPLAPDPWPADGSGCAALAAAWRREQVEAWARWDASAAALLAFCYAGLLLLALRGAIPPAQMVGGFVALALPAVASLAAPRWYRAPGRRTLVVAAARLGTMWLLPASKEFVAAGLVGDVATPLQALRQIAVSGRVLSLVLFAKAYPLPVPWLAVVQAAAVVRSAALCRDHLCRLPPLADSPAVAALGQQLGGWLRRLGAVAILWQAPNVGPPGGGRAAATAAATATAGPGAGAGAGAGGLSGGSWCFAVAAWLQFVFGYEALLLQQWFSTACSRRAFFRRRCREGPGCPECLGEKNRDLLGLGLALAAVAVQLALSAWALLVPGLGRDTDYGLVSAF